MVTEPIRIAMWSGPRNISTAMMRAWENRDDTAVSDEPLYGHYLKATGLPHPGAEEIMAAQDTDWRRVIASITGPVPGGRPIWYQKHMTQHLLPEIDTVWLGSLRHCFLIRSPEAVLASYARTRPDVVADDLGFLQQERIFAQVRERLGSVPPVLDSVDVLANPETLLRRLCAALDVPFSQSMLHWPAGPRDSDGVWCRYWYATVERSTGFAPPVATQPDLSPPLREIADVCRPAYEALYRHRV